MKTSRIILEKWLGLLLLLISVSTSALEVVDGTGATIRLPQSANRIISLTPHITELLYAVGAGDRLVGTVAYSDFPEQAKSLPRVGDSGRLDLEAVLSLQPDLVIAWASGTSALQLERLEQLGIPVYRSEPRKIADIVSEMKNFGVMAGTERTANEQSRRVEEAFQTLRREHAGQEKRRVFYQIWDRPLMTVTGEHLISDILQLCGGENIFADLSGLTATISTEAVLVRQPQVIIVAAMGESADQMIAAWQKWPLLPAVETARIVSINPDLMHRPGPRIVQGAQRLCALLAN